MKKLIIIKHEPSNKWLCYGEPAGLILVDEPEFATPLEVDDYYVSDEIAYDEDSDDGIQLLSKDLKGYEYKVIVGETVKLKK